MAGVEQLGRAAISLSERHHKIKFRRKPKDEAKMRAQCQIECPCCHGQFLAVYIGTTNIVECSVAQSSVIEFASLLCRLQECSWLV